MRKKIDYTQLLKVLEDMNKNLESINHRLDTMTEAFKNITEAFSKIVSVTDSNRDLERLYE